MTSAPTSNECAGRPQTKAAAPWLDVREKGSIFGVRVVLFLCSAFGRTGARLMLYPIALYYVLLHGQVRRSSRAYLSRVRGAQAGLREVYAHVLCFARVLLDRVFMLAGRDDLFEVSYSGHEHLVRLFEEKRGAVLLSAHIGSRSAMALGQRASKLRINIAGYGGNAKMINEVLGRFDKTGSLRIIEIEPRSPTSVLAIKALIAEGQMIALTADRTGLGDRTLRARFLGEDAAFSAGPFVLAGLLDCPIYLVFALYREPNRYELYCEPFAESMRAPRGRRAAMLQDCVDRYAARLEHFCRSAPYNWFNFYDFWGLR